MEVKVEEDNEGEKGKMRWGRLQRRGKKEEVGKVEKVNEKEMEEIVEENKETEMVQEEEEVSCWGIKDFCCSWPRHPQGSEKMALFKAEKEKKPSDFVFGG